MLYRVKYIHGGVESNMVLGCSNSRGPVTTAFFTPEVSDLAALQTAIIQQSGANLPDGMSLFTTFLSYNYIQQDLIYKAHQQSFAINHFIIFDNLTVNDVFKFNNGSYIKIIEKLGNGQAAGDSAVLRLEYRTKDDYLAYKVQIRADSNSLGYGYSVESVPMLFSPDNPGNYTINGFTIEYSTRYGTRAFISQGTSGGYYSGIVAPISAALGEAFWTGIKPYDQSDPYAELEDSEPSGPAEGEGYPEDELVPIPSLPSVSVVDTGFVTLFNPTLAQVKDLADYMWAGLFDVDTFKKIFADPMDCILGFNMLPVAIPNGGTASVVVGNISTGVSMTKAAGQWVELDCGSVAIDKPFGNYLDWSPYMKYSIYLPYIGTVDLSTDDIMGHTIHLVYHIDVLSCACVAYLEVDGRVMYQWTGSCGYSIPITGENFRHMIANIVNIAANLGGAIATGGMTAPLAIASAASVTQNVMSSKPEVHRSGAIGSSAGMLGMQKPYLIQQGPRICKPEKQYHYLGYPAFVTVQLGSVSGYQEFSSVILDGIPCTEEERDMIAAACEGGIYL